jgi:hypothetical protein
MKQDGKFTFGGFILILIILYGGYAAIMLISTSLMQSQIENEVTEALGFRRGAALTNERAYEAIKDILLKKDVIFDEKDQGAVDVTVDRRGGKILYYFRYDVEINFIFFKHRKTVEVKDEMRNYG